MAQLTRAQLQALWVTGYTPTQDDYVDLFDSFYNMLSTDDRDVLEGHFDTIYEAIGTAIGIMSAHENAFDHSLIATAIQNEIDPIFQQWLSNTPPAYPGDIPDELADLTDDSTHRLVTDTEKSTWNSKQDALGFTPEDVANKVIAFNVTPNDTDYPSEKLVKDNLDLKVPLQAITDSKGLSGFINGSNIDISYNYTNRTITLTGDLIYYWRGIKKELTSPWTSSAHTNSVGNWYLYSSDGDNFIWSNTIWVFSDVMTAYVRRGATSAESFGIRETHELMDFKSHEELHSQIGTYKVSGGILTVGTYVENSPIDADVSPGFNSAVIKDEDLISSVNTWVEGTYTTAYVGVGGELIFDTTKTRPFHDAGANTYIQINDPLAGTIVAGAAGNFYNVYQVIVPACSDSDSQKYRMIILQPQVAYNTLLTAQGEDVRGLNLGNFASLFTEFVIHARITYRTRTADNNAGRCRIETGGVTYISGNKAGQVSVMGFTTNNHAALSNLPWTISGHTGAINKLAGFGTAGEAVELTFEKELLFASSDETTAITNGVGKVSGHWPWTCTVTSCFIGIKTASSSGNTIVDFNDNAGNTIFSTRPTIIQGDKTSLQNATQPVFSTTSFTKGDAWSVDFDSAGTGVVALKFYMFGVLT